MSREVFYCSINVDYHDIVCVELFWFWSLIELFPLQGVNGSLGREDKI